VSGGTTKRSLRAKPTSKARRPFPSPSLLALPSWIDDSSRKPRLLDLARSAPWFVLRAFATLVLQILRVSSRVSPSSFISVRFSIRSLPSTKSFPTDSSGSTSGVPSASASPPLGRAPCPPRLSAGYNLAKYPPICSCLSPQSRLMYAVHRKSWGLRTLPININSIFVQRELSPWSTQCCRRLVDLEGWSEGFCITRLVLLIRVYISHYGCCLMLNVLG